MKIYFWGFSDYESDLGFWKFNMADQVTKRFDLEKSRYSSVFEIAAYKSGVGKAKLHD